MSNSSVTVLTPNGRRQNIKVEPNKTILHILEEACLKHNFEPQQYDLKHHKRILDLSQMYRFSGLPNNAQLEMVEVVKKRAEQDVLLMLQSEDGTRATGTFNPGVSIMEVLKLLYPNKCEDENNVIIYMRSEIYGKSIETTTLKSLGLTGGRAIIRLIQRNPETLKIQANVSALLPARPLVEEPKNLKSTVNEEPKTVKSLTGKYPNVIKLVKEQEPIEEEDLQIQENEDNMDVDQIEESEENSLSPIDRKKIRIEEAVGREYIEKEAEHMREEIEEPEIIVLGERNAVIFSLESTQHITFDDIHDSFFDLTVNDVKTLLRDLKTQKQSMDDAPLLTTKMREVENDNQMMLKLNRYKKAVIRIQFPDRLVLQGTFVPIDTIETVMGFIKPYLINENIEFCLYTTPPKHILTKESRLIEIHCVPTAVLHFGTEEIGNSKGNYLKEEYSTKLSSPSAAILAASKSRGIVIDNKSSNELESNRGQSTGAIPKQKISGNFKASSASTSDVKFPKWFKPPGK